MTETENKAREVVENGADTSEDAPSTTNSAAAVCSSEVASSVAAVPDKMVLLEKYKETLVYLCNFQNEYSSRVDSLLDSWKYITQILQQSTPDASENLFHWVLKYTVQLILVGDWVNIEQEKRDLIQHKIESILPQLQPGSMSRYRCDYILKNIENPWGNEDLLKVLRGDPWTVTDEDMEYLAQERGFMILLRLQKLCEIKCDEMAFVWSSKALTAYRSVDSEHVLRKSTSLKQFAFLLDVYLCHLHKYGHISHIIDEVKQLDLDSAQQLIHRNVNPNAEIPRLGKYRKRVARLASDIIIAKLMVEELTDQNEKYYCDILKEWLCIHKTVPVDEFRNNARKLYLTAISRKHLYVACDVIKQMEKDDFRELLLELCVRAITGELNELELLKSEKSCDEHIVIQHEVDLSYRYIYLADLLKNHTPLAQECVLTAFSLNPTKENYQLVRDIAMRKQTEEHTSTESNKPTPEPSSSAAITSSSSQDEPVDKAVELLSNQLSDDVTITKVVTSSSCSAAMSSSQQTQLDQTLEGVTITTAVTPTKPPISEITTGDVNLRNLSVTPGPSKGHEHRTSIDVLHSITGSSKIFESPSYDALAAPSSIFDSLETVEIPNHLRSDLSVLLSNPRLKILSWMLPWPELDTHCQKLLKEDCKLSIVRQSLAGANDKLQYLHLDYNMFRHLPESECPGIEKGYEQYSIDPDDLAGLVLKRKKSKKSKKSSKERKEKIEKPTKSTKNRKDQKVRKKSQKPSSAPSSQALQTLQPATAAGTASVCPLAAQRAREYEELLRRALYIQQLQHQLQLSQSLSMLNQHTPVNRNFFLPYLAAQMQDKNKNDKPAIAAPPAPVPLQKVTKISEIVKKSSPKPPGSSMPPPLQLTLPPRPSNSKGQPEQTHFLLQPVQRMQQGQDVQVVHQMQPVQQQQPPPQLQIISSSASVQKIVTNLQHQSATATVQQTQNKPVLVQPVLIKDNNTLVKLAILKNITQKMLLQRQQQQQQQQMQQHVHQQQQLQSSPSSSGSSTPTALPPRRMTNPPALQLSQTNVILNPLNTFHNDSNFGIIRNIPTSTITSIQTSIARCNLPVETTVPAPMKLSSVIKPNAQISVQPNSGKNIYTCSPLGTVTTVVKIAQTKPTISKATIAKTATKTTTVKSVKVKSFPAKADSATKKTTTDSPKVIPALTPSAKASTTKSKVVKSSPVKIKVNPAGLTLLPAESLSGILRKFEGHSSTAPPLSVILPAPLHQIQKENVLPHDSSSTESAPESLKYNLNLYVTNEDKTTKIFSPQIGSLKKKPKKPKEVKPKELKTPKEPKKSKEPKSPKEPKSSKLMKTPKEPKMSKGKILSPSKSPKVQKIQKSEKVKRVKTPKSQSPSTSATSEPVPKFLNLNVQQDVTGPSVASAAEEITSPGLGIIQAAGTIPLPLEEAQETPAPQEGIIEEMAGDTSELVPISASREIEQYIIKIREGLVDDSTKDVTSQDEENNEIIDMLLDMEENKELTEKTASPNTEIIPNEPPPLPTKLDDLEPKHSIPEINAVPRIFETVPEVASTITVETTKEQKEEIVAPDPEIFTEATRKSLSSPLYPENSEKGANTPCELNDESCSSPPAENIRLKKEKNNSSEEDSTVKSKENFTEDFLDHVSRESNSPIPPALQDDYDVFPIQIPGILNTSFRSDAEEEAEKYSLNVRPDEINPSIDLPAEERCSQVMHTIFQRQSKSQVEPNEEIAHIFSNSAKREKRDPRIYLRRLQRSDYENDESPEKSGRGSKSRAKDVGKVLKSQVKPPIKKFAGKEAKSAIVRQKRGRGRPPKNKNYAKKPVDACPAENEGSDFEVEAILSTKQEPSEDYASERSIRPKTAMLRAYYAKKPLPSTPKRPKSSVPSGRPRGRPRKNPLPPPKPSAPARKSEPTRARIFTSVRTPTPVPAPVRIPDPAPQRPSSIITLSSDSESELTLIQMKLNGLRRAREMSAALATAPVPVVILQDPVRPPMRKKSGRCHFPYMQRAAAEEKKRKKISRPNSSRRRWSTRRSDTDDSDDSYRPNSRPRPRGRSRRRRRSSARSIGYRSDNEFRRRTRSRSNTPLPRCRSAMQGGPGSSRRQTFHGDSDSWMDQNVPILSPRRRSGRSRSKSTQTHDSFSNLSSSSESSVNTEIELLNSVGVRRGPGPRRLRRTSTLNVSYYDQDSSDDESHYFRRRRCDTPRFYKTPTKKKNRGPRSNFNVPNAALRDPKLYIQTPIVELMRYSGSRRKTTSSPFTTDTEAQTEWKSSKSSQQPKRIKKIYLKNIRSSQIAIVNESSCSSPRTEPETLGRRSEAKKRARKPKSLYQGQKQALPKNSSKIRRQGQSMADMPRRGRAQKRGEAPKRAVSMPLAVRDRSQPPRRIIRHPGKMELRLDKLDNRTMLQYRQSILVNGVLVSSPVIALKRLKINQLPMRLSSHEFQEEVSRRPKPWGPHRLRKTFPTHIRKTIREELLDKCGLLTNRNPYSRFINLTDYAELPHEQWNNLDMFQVSSDEDSILEQAEMRRPPKIPRIDNKLTKNCNMTKEAVSKDRQSSPREFAPQLGSKKNFMYDIYSVIVKPDFLDSPPSSLFSCNMKKENVSKTAPATSPATVNASDLFLSIAAKFLIKSLSVTEEKQHLVYEMMSDKKDFWFPDNLGRRILEREITEILCGVRNILKDTISAIVPNKRFRLVNETLDESKTDYYLNKKLINILPAPPKGDSLKKWTGKFDTPAYNELRNLIYRRTLGEKFNNKTLEFGELFGSKPENKINENRILFEVPGFRTLEYFSAPSYHCLPVVRIVHSTLPLEEKAESEPSSSEVSGEVPKNSTTSQSVTVAGEGQKATLVPVVHKTFGAPQTEGATGNVRVIIPQGSGPKKGPPSIHYTGAIKTTATLIKVDKKEVQERISKIEPNFVLLGCGNNSKFVPIKKDDRILLASSAGGVHEGGADEETQRGTIQQCRLIETSTLKTVPKVSLSSGSSSSSTTTTTILPVQFIYKSDGGMIHFTPVSGVTGLQNLNVGKELKTISLVKAETTKTGHCIETGTTSHLSVINTRSLYEENYAKFIQTSSASQENSTAVIQAFVQQTVDPSPPTLSLSSTTVLNSSLPKFTQAFGGKTIYIEGTDDGLAKKDQNKGAPGHPGNFIMSKQNVTISRPIICSVAESFTKNKMTSTVPSARIVSGTKQQLKIIQTGETGAATTTTTAIGQRTTLLSPLPISVPIVSQSAISSYVQTRYMRPFLHISQGNLQGSCPSQGAQQVVITTSSQAASSNIHENSISTATTKIKCLPTLTVTKRERPGKPLDEKKLIKKEEHVDNSTLEQLREFDLVLEQVKERSTTSSSSQPLKAEGTDAMSQTEATPARKCAIKIEKEALSHGTSSLMNLKLIQKTPFIVVGNSLTAHARVFTSPTKSVCVEKPRPGEMHSTQATQTKQTIAKNSIMPVAKLKTPQKPIGVGGTAVISPAAAAAAAYTQKISKPQEDEQTVQRIYDILAEYAEQLRNSPDLNNKPAPRRRSNPLNSCTANGKKRKTLIQKPSDSSLASTDLDQTMDSEDSSCGTSSLYNRSPLHDSSTSIDSSNHFLARHQQHQQQQTSSVKSETEGGVIAIVDASTKVQNSASGQSSKISITQQQSVNVINFDLANQSQGNRTTAVLVPGKYLFPLNAIKSGELLETKEAIKKFGTTSGQSQVVYKTRPVKIADTLTHQKGVFKPITAQNSRHPAGLFSSAQRKSIEPNCAGNKIEGGISKTSIVFQTQPGGGNSANFTTAMQRNNLKIINVQQPSAAEVQETSVITKISEKEQILHPQQLHLPLSSTMLAKIQQNGEILKRQTSDKIRNNLRLDSGQSTSSKILKQLNEGRKLALERELKFHKSLSDECEDLGVDEPSASDLFPEADLLFDPTSSSFETNSQDDEIPRDLNAKTPPKGQGGGGATNGDFSGSSILRTTSLREVIGWDSAETTGAIIKNSNNFIIQHTSGDPFRKSPPWSPAKDLFNLGFKNAGSGEEEDEAADGEEVSVAAVAASRKRRLSSRGPAARKSNCPCYTPPPGAATAAATPATATVLNSSTQTLSTAVNGPPGSARSGRLLSPSQIAEHFAATKRIRAVKVSPVSAEGLQLKIHRLQKTTEPQKEAPAGQSQQTVLAAPVRRALAGARFAKVSRR